MTLYSVHQTVPQKFMYKNQICLSKEEAISMLMMLLEIYEKDCRLSRFQTHDENKSL